MKIKILHKNNDRYESIRHLVAEKEKTASISGGIYAVDALLPNVSDAAPDLLIIDDAAPSCLDSVATLSLHSPGTETLLISSDSSAEFLMHAMRSGVREVVPTSGGAEALQAALARTLHKRNNHPVATSPQRVGKVFAFLSCKGGSGATFLASNFAYVLASEFGKRVALIDLNLQFGDAALFVSNARPPSDISELAQQIHRLDASLLEASMLEVAPNFHVLAAPDDPAHAIDVKREHVEAILQLAREHFDFVVIDISRSLDALSILALDFADTIYPVLQLTLPYVRDGKRLLSVFRSLGYPHTKIRLLVNRYEKGGELTLQDMERALGEKVFQVIENSYTAAAASVNLGIPIAKGNRDNSISRKLIEMGQEYAPQDRAGARSGWLSRLFGRTDNAPA